MINNSVYQSVKKHIKNNAGSAYIWLLVFVSLCLCLMSGIMMTAKVNIAVNSINNEIEIASDYVMADYKKKDYSKWLSESSLTGLRDGTLVEPPGVEDTLYNTGFTASTFAQRLAQELKNQNEDALIVYDNETNMITRYAQEVADEAIAYQILVNDVESANGKFTVNFTVHIFDKMVGIKGFEDIQTYTKSTQLHLKEYKYAPKLEARPQANPRITPAVISRASDDESSNFVYGLREYIQESVLLNQYIYTSGDGRIEIDYDENNLAGSFGYTGTGTVVNVYDRNGTNTTTDDVLAESFEIVIFGDLNGDGVIQAVDATYVWDELKGITNWSQKDSSTYSASKTRAADANHDGEITEADATLIGDHTIGMARIVQSP